MDGVKEINEKYHLVMPADFSSGDIICGSCGSELWIEPQKHLVKGWLNPNANEDWEKPENIYNAYKIIWPSLIENRNHIMGCLTCPQCDETGKWSIVRYGMLDYSNLAKSLSAMCAGCSSILDKDNPLVKSLVDGKHYCLDCLTEVVS